MSVSPQAVPLSLYVHIPWCVRKCPYCDFNSHVHDGALPEARYIDALLSDLDDELPLGANRELVSVFFGGGTPSLFSAGGIARILQGVRERLPLAHDCEITLEANPGTADAGHFAGYRQAGVNRLSIGVQSFQPAHLQALGRIHDSRQAMDAIALAREAGFSRVNVDLMHGLPGQSVADALGDLRTAIDCGANHLSWYQLTIEPNTVFHSSPPRLPDEPLLLDILAAGEACLKQAGFTQYEVSAWGLRGEQAAHNINYWSFGDYIGIGAGAHGKLTLPDGRIIRRWKTRLPAHYLDTGKTPLAGEAAIDADALPLEFFMNALRLRRGVPASLFARTGLSLDTVRATLDGLRHRGLLQADAQRLAATDLGFRHLDTVLQAFM